MPAQSRNAPGRKVAVTVLFIDQLGPVFCSTECQEEDSHMRTSKNLKLALALALAVPTLALAQTPAPDTRPAPGVDRTVDRDDRNWGWIGLLGLAGLAGLKRRDAVHDRDRLATGVSR